MAPESLPFPFLPLYNLSLPPFGVSTTQVEPELAGPGLVEREKHEKRLGEASEQQHFGFGLPIRLEGQRTLG